MNAPDPSLNALQWFSPDAVKAAAQMLATNHAQLAEKTLAAHARTTAPGTASTPGAEPTAQYDPLPVTATAITTTITAAITTDAAKKKDPAPRATTIHHLDALGHFKGAIRSLINPQSQKSAVVVDLGCADVAVICSQDFFGSSNYLSLLGTLRGPRFWCTVQKECIASETLIADIYDKKIGKNVTLLGEDNKFIVTYDDLVSKAVDLNATDIHFEVTHTEQSKVKLRIFGRLKEWKTLPTELLKGALTAAYSKRTKSGTNSAGALSLERAMNTITEQVINGKTYNGRFSGYPLVNGYDVVIRLLDSDPNSTIPSIQSLGYAPYHVVEQILPAIQRNSGMMAIAGSTGSGKSTALRSFIHAIPERNNLKIYGVEDPVEYLNPFMRQISVQRNSDDPDDVVKMKFLSALRSVLRMDPDVLMLGEIRDHESASIASEFNRTGHRVFTTVHGDGCIDVLARMSSDEIGIHPQTLAAKKYLSAVMYQKLLPRLCPHCKVPAKTVLPEKTQYTLRQKFNVDPGTMYVANDSGCPYCRMQDVGIAGTKGMTVVAEILTPTEAIRESIREQDWMQVEKLWRSQRTAGFDSPHMGGKTAFEHALYKACAGQIDPFDIEADFESFETYAIFGLQAP